MVGAAAGERGEAIVAFVVPKPSAEIGADELRAHCRALASSYKVPDHVELCAALPVTETGKLFRRELRSMAENLILLRQRKRCITVAGVGAAALIGHIGRETRADKR